jgi:hypothetical protein
MNDINSWKQHSGGHGTNSLIVGFPHIIQQEYGKMATQNMPIKEGVYDTPGRSAGSQTDDVRTVLLNKISWGAVLAGVVVSLVAHLILNMIGIGVGASTVDVAAADNPAASSFSIGAAIWWTVSGIIAAFLGGYTAGRLSGKPKNSTASWHGLVTWALTTLMIFWLLSSAVGGILGGIYNTVSGAVGSVGSAAGTAAQSAAPSLANVSDPFSQIEQSVRSSTGGNDPQALRDAAVAAVRASVTGDQAQAQEARERAAQALSKAQGIPVEEARTQVQQYQQQYQQTVDQAKQQAAEAADTAASTIATGALAAAIALLLGAIGGWFGGRTGAVDPVVTASATTASAKRGF